MNEILQYLKKHGEQLDSEIAVATGNSLATVRRHLSELSPCRCTTKIIKQTGNSQDQ